MLERSDVAIEQRLPGFDEIMRPATEQLHLQWDAAEDRERQSRSIFAQHTIDPDEVAAELASVQDAVGSRADVETFVATAVGAYGGVTSGGTPTTLELGEAPRAFRDALGLLGDHTLVKAAFDLPVPDGVVYLSRTHPIVAGLAGHVLDEALDPLLDGKAARAGVIETSGVAEKTTLLLCRFRMSLTAESRHGRTSMLAEDAVVVGFTGNPTSPTWLDPSEAEPLLDLRPEANVNEAVQQDLIAEVLRAEPDWRPALDEQAVKRADELMAAHGRVREAAGRRGGTLARYRAEAQTPVDVLGVYVYLPRLIL